MNRLHEWQLRLSAVIRERLHMPFAWGVNDCCSFAAACVEAVTGQNPMADLEYADESEALRIVREGGGLPTMIAARLGGEVIPALAQVGDIGLWLQEGERETLAVNVGHWMATGADGLVTLPPGVVVRAWRVC